jgi:hypothetical protein
MSPTLARSTTLTIGALPLRMRTQAAALSPRLLAMCANAMQTQP